MGAWAAAPDRPIVAVTGDGGFGQYLAELTTAVKYGMPITHVLLDNGAARQDHQGAARGRVGRVADLAAQPRLRASTRELCGAHGVRVDRRDELDDALTAALAHDGPALVAVHADPDLI